jgi:hypothetical protein
MELVVCLPTGIGFKDYDRWSVPFGLGSDVVQTAKSFDRYLK